MVRANQLINQNFDLPPSPLEEILNYEDSWDKNLEFRPVKTNGQYLPDSSLLIRNRPYDGQPGFLQLVAFRTNAGSVIWIERGWLPTGLNQDSPDAIPALDSRNREVIIRLRPTEGQDSREAPAGQLPNIDLPRASKTLANEALYLQAYGRLVSENPELDRGVDLGKPSLSEGNHLSYAFQWIIFGLMAFGAVFWNIAQDRRRMRGQQPRKLASLNRDRDAEVEDEILEK